MSIWKKLFGASKQVTPLYKPQPQSSVAVPASTPKPVEKAEKHTSPANPIQSENQAWLFGSKSNSQSRVPIQAPKGNSNGLGSNADTENARSRLNGRAYYPGDDYSVIFDIDALGEAGNAADIELLSRYLLISNDAIRFTACSAIQKCGISVTEIQKFYLKAMSKNELRDLCLKSLSRLGWVPDDPVQRVTALLISDNWQNLVLASPPDVDILISLLGQKDKINDKVLERAVTLLLKTPSKKIVGALIDLLKQGLSGHAAYLAANFLSDSEDPRVLPAFLDILQNRGRTDFAGIEEMVDALGRSKNRLAFPVFLDLCTMIDNEIHIHAAEALAQLDDSRAVPVLLQVLKAGNLRHPYRLAETLKFFSEKSTAEFVLALEDESQLVRSIAKQNLSRLGWKPSTTEEKLLFEGHMPPRVLMKRLDSGDPSVRRESAVSLGKVRHQAAASQLANLLGDADRSVRMASAQALMELGWMPTTPAQKAVFYSGNRDWTSLTALDTPEAVKEWFFWIVSEDKKPSYDEHEIVKRGKEALEQMQNPSAASAIVDLVGFGGFQSWAFKALKKKVNATSAWLQLMSYKGFNNREVQQIAAEELASIGTEDAIISVLRALPEMSSNVHKGIMQHLKLRIAESQSQAVRYALNKAIEQLFTGIDHGMLFGQTLQALGADEKKIVNAYVSVLVRLERPTGYEKILDYFVKNKSREAVLPLIELIRVPKPGCENFYKDIVRTIGDIGDFGAVVELYELLNSTWKVYGRPSGSQIIDSKWIEPTIMSAIRKLEQN